MKDAMIPLSIVLAGIFIGAGLYFGSGQPSAPVAVVTNPGETAEPAVPTTNTDKVLSVTSDDYVRGSVGAPITIVEYSDFDCSFCGRFHDTMKNIIAKDDSVAWVYRHFPVLGPQSPAVAMASLCAGELAGNEGFWKFADEYFAARATGDRTAHAELIPRLVQAQGINQGAFTECFESNRHAETVQSQATNAAETGGRGTPWSILIGPTGKTYPINGALPQATIEQLIEVAKQEA
jgi:protein-disulfide isomerase